MHAARSAPAPTVVPDEPLREPAALAAPAPPPPAAGDDDASAEAEGPEWPDEAVESAMRAEERERDGERPIPERRPRVAPTADAEEGTAPLPPLDSLVAQIPADVRETLEELFRARFTQVQRVPKAALK